MEGVKMAKKTSPEIEQEIIKLYQSGLSMAKAGAPYNISSATVMAILNRNNIPKRTKGGIYQIPEKEVITRYQQGESCQNIADSFNVTFNTISNILEKNNIARNNKYKNLNLDENYFEKIDRIDKAYFLGFMLTDGNVSVNGNIIRLSLSSKDKEILNIFKEKTGNENKICIREDEKHSERTFQLRSKKWKDDLSKYGVVPQKTNIGEMPMIQENMMPHLIRGMIDGDGWISAPSHQLGFCGNEKTVTQLKNYLVETLNVYNVKVIQSGINLWQVDWASIKDIIKIGNYIYQDKNDCYLKRKYDNFLQIIHDNTEVTNQIAKG